MKVWRRKTLSWGSYANLECVEKDLEKAFALKQLSSWLLLIKVHVRNIPFRIWMNYNLSNTYLVKIKLRLFFHFCVKFCLLLSLLQAWRKLRAEGRHVSSTLRYVHTLFRFLPKRKPVSSWTCNFWKSKDYLLFVGLWKQSLGYYFFCFNFILCYFLIKYSTASFFRLVS